MVTIAIIGVLAGVVLIAIDPAKQIQRAGDAGRKSDISQVAGALEAYGVSHNGAYIAGVSNSMTGGVEGKASEKSWNETLATSGEIKNVRDGETYYDSDVAGVQFRVFRVLAAAQLAWEEGVNDRANNGASNAVCTGSMPTIGTPGVYYVYDTNAGKPYWFCVANNIATTFPTPAY